MGGGLLQLVAYGAQDVYLSGNPQITFFKVAYRRHTNFSMESIEQTFNGTADFGRRVTCQISRNGDLIHRMYLQVAITGASFPANAYAGLALVKSVELEIGGQRIDKQYGDWMYIWNELSLPIGKMTGFKEMVGGGSTAVVATNTTMFIPLEFWFCRNPGLALPLIALQYHEVKVNLEFDTAKNASITAGTMGTASLWVDYIFLDTDERRRFAQLSHEYLIEQLQFTGEETITGVSNKVKLNFNHPVKELVWVMQQDADSGTTAISNFGCYDSVGEGATALLLERSEPVLITEYERRYFEAVGASIRITVDSDLAFYPQVGRRHASRRFGERVPDLVILEVKIPMGGEGRVRELLHPMAPWVSRSSKYVMGCQYLGLLSGGHYEVPV